MFSCLKCSPCCNNTQEHDIEPQCLKQGFSRDKACRYTDRNCGGLQPTLKTMLFKTTATQTSVKIKLPLPYLIASVLVMFVVLVLALVTALLMHRVYCSVKHDQPGVAVKLSGKQMSFCISPYVYLYMVHKKN